MKKTARLALSTCQWLAAIVAPAPAWPASFDEDFVVVYIDRQTEAKHGPLPLRRELLATGIERIADAGARGLVMKFFFDLSSSSADDQHLARAFSRMPTVLQARIDAGQTPSNPLPEHFSFAGDFDTAVAGAAGWLPLPQFASAASDIGFVDFNTPVVPMIERFQARYVKSLVLCAIELAAGQKMLFHPGHNIEVGPHTIPVDRKNQATARLAQAPMQGSVSFNAVLDGSAQAIFKNKVVILAYDGPHIDTFATPQGPMGAHRYFIHILRSLYDGA
ncbi:MAG: CHASE2 domain-containing protein [Pseudomonadota bacterium]